MKRFWLGLFVGILICSGAFYPFLKMEQKDKYEFGRNQGYAKGQLDVAKSIASEFGEVDGTNDDHYSWVMGIKDIALVAVEVNGVRTIRVSVPRAIPLAR
jgi:hypothetical protein